MKKCMEIRVEVRRPVDRSRKILVSNMETDMAELEIDREETSMKKSYDEEVQPY